MTVVLTGPLPVNINFPKDVIGGSVSNALLSAIKFGKHLDEPETRSGHHIVERFFKCIECGLDNRHTRFETGHSFVGDHRCVREIFNTRWCQYLARTFSKSCRPIRSEDCEDQRRRHLRAMQITRPVLLHA